MKQYIIDELRPKDYEELKAHLDHNCSPGSLEGIYWIPLEKSLLTDIQHSHETCQPFFFALELFVDHIACELLVRTRERVRCDCIGYATDIQRNWVIRYIDEMFESLGIRT